MPFYGFAQGFYGHLISSLADVASVAILVEEVDVAFLIVVGVVFHLGFDEKVGLFAFGEMILLANGSLQSFHGFRRERIGLDADFKEVAFGDASAELAQNDVAVRGPILDAAHHIEIIEFKEFVQDGRVFFKVVPSIICMQEVA